VRSFPCRQRRQHEGKGNVYGASSVGSAADECNNQCY